MAADSPERPDETSRFESGKSAQPPLPAAPLTAAELGRHVTERINELLETNAQLRGKLAEHEKAEAEHEKIAALVENSTDFIGLATLDGEALFVNRAGQALVGLRHAAQVRATRIFDYVPANEQARLRDEILPIVTDQGRWGGEMQFRHFETSELIPMLTQIFFIQESGTQRPLAMATISRDITERKRAEEALRISEERFRHYFEFGLIGMAITSPTKRFLEVNDELCRILGYGRDELLKLDWSQIMHADDLAADLTQFERVLAGEIDGYLMDRRFMRKRGDLIETTVAVKGLRRADRSVAYFIGLVLDITERRRAEEVAQRAQAELARVMRITALGELAASIGHELSQPLGAIVNNSNACLRLSARNKGSKQELREALADIVKDATRASEIIARIRALGKRSTGGWTSLQLADVVADVLALVQPELAKRHFLVELDVPRDLPGVMGDRVQLQQVLLNLIMNAIEAMTETRTTRHDAIAITGTPHQLAQRPAVLIAVRDSGVGLEPEVAARLFESFYTTKPHGTGLGLRISRSIIEAHGGKIWGTSNATKGATFCFALPVNEKV